MKKRYHVNTRLGILSIFLIFNMAFITKLSAQNTRPFKDKNLWGYKDKSGWVKLKPKYDIATPMLNNFYHIEPLSTHIDELLDDGQETAYFTNPIGIIFKGDSLGLVNHNGEVLQNPIKCRLTTIYQHEEMKFIENLEPESEYYGKFALIYKSGLHVSPFIFCDIEEWDGGYVNHHMNFGSLHEIKDVLLLNCDGGTKVFMNQTDGFQKEFSNTVFISLASNGYYFIQNSSKIDLYHNDKYIKSITLPEKTNYWEYSNFGILALFSEDEHITLIDTSGRIIYENAEGNFLGINGHGHGKFCHNDTCFIIDIEGRVLQKTTNVEFSSTKDGYISYSNTETTYYDKFFRIIEETVIQSETDKTNQEIDPKYYFNLCENFDFVSDMQKKMIVNLMWMVRHELDKGKYVINEVKSETNIYFLNECSADPFFPESNITSFEYKGNDIFFLYTSTGLTIYDASEKWTKNLDSTPFDQFTFQGKTYYVIKENYYSENMEIYNESFTRIERKFRNIDIKSKRINYLPIISQTSNSLRFKIFDIDEKEIPFKKLSPELAFANIKFTLFTEFDSSSSVFIGIKDTFSFHIIEINFLNIIEAPEHYRINEYTLEYDSTFHKQLLSDYLSGKADYKTFMNDTLLCAIVNNGLPVCFNVFNKKILQIPDEKLFPEKHAIYHNRLLTVDCFDVGYKNSHGELVIPFKYNINYTTNFKGGTAIVTKRDENNTLLYALIDTSDQILIPFSSCYLRFNFSGQLVIKDCHKEKSDIYWLYDNYGNLLEQSEYIGDFTHFVIISTKDNRYRVYTTTADDFFDIDKYKVLDWQSDSEQLLVKIGGREYQLVKNELVELVDLKSTNKKKDYRVVLNQKRSLLLDGGIITFMDPNDNAAVSFSGSLSRVDYINEHLWLKNRLDEVVLFDYNGKMLINSSYDNLQYYPQHNFYIGRNFSGDYDFYYVD